MVRPLYYILDANRLAIPCRDHMEWARWFEYNERRVAFDEIPDWGGRRISTVFIGMDLSFGAALPLVFETMIFPKEKFTELWCRRTGTWVDAEAAHREALVAAKLEHPSEVTC